MRPRKKINQYFSSPRTICEREGEGGVFTWEHGEKDEGPDATPASQQVRGTAYRHKVAVCEGEQDGGRHDADGKEDDIEQDQGAVHPEQAERPVAQ